MCQFFRTVFSVFAFLGSFAADWFFASMIASFMAALTMAPFIIIEAPDAVIMTVGGVTYFVVWLLAFLHD